MTLPAFASSFLLASICQTDHFCFPVEPGMSLLDHAGDLNFDIARGNEEEEALAEVRKKAEEVCIHSALGPKYLLMGRDLPDSFFDRCVT